MNKFTKVLAVMAFALIGNTASAVVLTHGSSGGVFTWDNGQYPQGSSDFDRAEFSFASEFADTITLANFGNGYAHDHGSNALLELEVFDGSNWITVFSSSVPTDTGLSAFFGSPITFAGMYISGLRLDASGTVGNMYHSIDSQMTYTTSGNNVPEPASLALLGLGLAGLAGMKKKSLAAK